MTGVPHIPATVRRWGYRVTGAALVVAGVYGFLDGNQSAAWLLLASAMFGVADRNVNPDADRNVNPDARRAADE